MLESPGPKSWKLDDEDFLTHIKSSDITFLIDTCAGFYFNIKPRRSNSGSSLSLCGIAAVIKDDLRKAKAVCILEEKSNHECDMLRLRLDETYFGTISNTSLGGIYIPPANSKYFRFTNIDRFQIIEDDINYFSSIGNVVTCGKFNSRLENCSDAILESAKDNSFVDLPSDYHFDYLRRRQSMDVKTNRYKKPF